MTTDEAFPLVHFNGRFDGEVGIFSDEGLLEDGIYSVDEAKARLATYDSDDNAYPDFICTCGVPGCKCPEGSCDCDDASDGHGFPYIPQ